MLLWLYYVQYGCTMCNVAVLYVQCGCTMCNRAPFFVDVMVRERPKGPPLAVTDEAVVGPVVCLCVPSCGALLVSQLCALDLPTHAHLHLHVHSHACMRTFTGSADKGS